MSRFDTIIASIKKEDYPDKKQLLEYTLRLLQNIQKGKKPLGQEDAKALLDYAFEEVDALLLAIPQAETYQRKDLLFDCENLILGLIMHLCPSPSQIPVETMAKIKLLVKTVEKERYLETTLDKLFQQEAVSGEEAEKLLSLVRQTSGEYQKGKLYEGLNHYAGSLSKLSGEAKARIAAYLAEELRRYLALSLRTQEHINNLELAADVCKHFANEEILSLLSEVLGFGYGNVNYYAAETLLAAGKELPREAIVSLAKDLGYADLTYRLLGKYGKQALFPEECRTAEYLAKSDMVHWLLYPTELGKAPDEIEYVGKVTYLFRKDVYYVFRFRSDSDTLGEEKKNKWLIGWSSEDGGTFSNFDEYALYEKGTVEATLKNIKKKLIG